MSPGTAKQPWSSRRVRAGLGGGAALLVAGVIAAAGFSAGGAAARPAPRAAVRHGVVRSVRRGVRRTDAYAVPANPFNSPAMRRFLTGRGGNVTAGVEDIASGRVFLYHPGDREETASIVKVDILATLLHQADADDSTLSAGQDDVATGMIEESDNDDATELWDEEGGAPAVAAFDAKLDMTQTTPNGAWGLTETTPRDQLRLLSHVALKNTILPLAARHYELNLMENVVGWERWGVSAGPPSGVTVALKNGWLPTPNVAWQVNSIGYVHGDGRDYLIAVMTNDESDEGYGIDTIEGIASLVWSELRHHPAPGGGSTGSSGATGPSGSSGTT
jgi:hypothetical protein